MKLSTILWPVSYVLSIVLVNLAFTVLPMIDVMGAHVPIGAFLVGFIFVVRDYAQREIGHWVIGAMLFAGVLSYFMADPYVALASVAAFLFGEFADWAVFSFTGYPFSKRILLSSSIGTPIDSVTAPTIFASVINTTPGQEKKPAISRNTAVWLLVSRQESVAGVAA